MAQVSENGNFVTLEKVRVYYDRKSDTTHITSSDPELPPQGMRMTVKRGSPTDSAFRSVLEANGVVASKFEPSIPGQTSPISLARSRNPRQLRAALLPKRRYGFAQVEWSPGIHSEDGLLTDAWGMAPALVVTGAPGSGKTSLVHSLLTQVAHKNGPGEARLVVVESGSELAGYGALDSVEHTGGADADAFYAALADAGRVISERVRLFEASPAAPRDLEAARSSALTETLLGPVELSENDLYLPYYVLVLDGYGPAVSRSLRRNPESINRALSRVVEAGRDVGVYVALTAHDVSEVPDDVLDRSRRVAFTTTSNDEHANAPFSLTELRGLRTGSALLLAGTSAPTRFTGHSLRI